MVISFPKTDKTMKKTYINPELVVVKIATHQMLASSPVAFDDLGGGEIILTDTELGTDPEDEVLGREYDFDFDEEGI